MSRRVRVRLVHCHGAPEFCPGRTERVTSVVGTRLQGVTLHPHRQTERSVVVASDAETLPTREDYNEARVGVVTSRIGIATLAADQPSGKK